MEKNKKVQLVICKQEDTQIHTQLDGYVDFVTQLLGAGPSTSNQQGCDSQSSDSELTCNDIVDASDLGDAGSRNQSLISSKLNNPVLLFLIL